MEKKKQLLSIKQFIPSFTIELKTVVFLRMFNDLIKVIINAFAQIVEEAGLCTTGGTEIEGNKFIGRVSTIMRVLSKDGDVTTFFDKSNENDFNNKSLKEILIDNHTKQANKRKLSGQMC